MIYQFSSFDSFVVHILFLIYFIRFTMLQFYGYGYGVNEFEAMK